MPRRYWLMKSEPTTFSFDDLRRSPGGTTSWDGVRNYQARNLLRDEIATGDGVLFYHSSTEHPAVVGTAEVVRAGHPDPTQFDRRSPHCDPDADRNHPRWYLVDIKAGQPFARAVTLEEMRTVRALASMVLLRKGSRLSVQPVTRAEWTAILDLGGRSARPRA